MDRSVPHTSTPLSVERRLQKTLQPEPIVAWGRAWVWRDGRLAGVFASRTLDFTVLTDDHLYLVSMGFFTRRPRRRVYAITHDRLRVEEYPAKSRRRLRLRAQEHRPLMLEMRGTARNRAFADELVARTRPGDAETV
jgi:hypothetical protein